MSESEFGDDEIRIELRKIVEREQSQLLKSLTETENKMISALREDGSDNSDNDADLKNRMATLRGNAAARYTQMLNFIDR